MVRPFPVGDGGVLPPPQTCEQIGGNRRPVQGSFEVQLGGLGLASAQ